jgi:hypothetical protein
LGWRLLLLLCGFWKKKLRGIVTWLDSQWPFSIQPLVLPKVEHASPTLAITAQETLVGARAACTVTAPWLLGTLGLAVVTEHAAPASTNVSCA